MTKKTDDLELEDSDDAGAPDPKPAKPSVDYERKYNGLNSAHSKLLEEKRKLEEKYNEAVAELEGAQAQAKDSVKPLNDQIRALTNERDTAARERDDFKSKYDGVVTKGTKSAEFKEKFPNIFDEWDQDLLKAQKDFESEEKYLDYLKLLNDKRAPKEQDKKDVTPAPQPQDRRKLLEGVVPNVPSTPRGNGQRSVDDIRKEMQTLDRFDKDYRKTMDTLTAEMDAALGSSTR